MNRQQEQLFARIQAFEIDDTHAQTTFAQRLARENRWPLDYALRVIDEYKKFLFLAIAAGHPVTPSHIVDQAWHLHLTYTRSYWDRLCAGVLGRPLHHDPSRGGDEEERKYKQWYANTLESYQRLFGESPLRDIWPRHPQGGKQHGGSCGVLLAAPVDMGGTSTRVHPAASPAGVETTLDGPVCAADGGAGCSAGGCGGGCGGG